MLAISQRRTIWRPPCLQFLGNYSEAKDCYEQGISISKHLRDRASLGSSLTNLGIVHRSLGRFELAIRCFDRKYIKSNVKSALNVAIDPVKTIPADI